MNEHVPDIGKPSPDGSVVEVSAARLRRVLFHLRSGQRPTSPRENAKLASAIEVLGDAAVQPRGADGSASPEA